VRAHARLRHAAGAQLRKHVYCEKRSLINIEETRVIREAAAKAKVATQWATQIHAGDNYRRVVEAGAERRHRSRARGSCCGWTSVGLASPEDAAKNHDIVAVRERPAGTSPIPERTDWDLWLRPGAVSSIQRSLLPGTEWYRWWDFGNGR